MLTTPDILVYFFVITTAIAALTFAELIISFKHPFFMNLMLQLMIVAIFFNAISAIYQLKVGYHRWLLELPKAIFGAAGINFFAYIYNQQRKKFFMYLGLLLMLQRFYWLLHFSFIQPIDVHLDLITIKKYATSIKFVRIFFPTLFLVVGIDIYRKILLKYQFDNIYFQKMRKWSLYGMISITLIFASNLVYFLNDKWLYATLFVKWISNTTCLLFILFRPKFMNNTHLKITLSETFNFKQIDEVSAVDFIDSFYTNHYYLNRDANIDALADLMKLTTEELKTFVEEKYELSFIDLLNKQRVAYFVDLISTGNYHHYTLDALAQMSGFNSRQNLTRSFKIFHGGTPSELMKAIMPSKK